MSIKINDVGLQFNSNHSDRSGEPKGIVLHHAAANGSVQDVHRWHLANGWAGIGYHFYVRKDGSVYKGRPESWLGAHTEGHNDMIGICAEGNFMTDIMSDTQREAVAQVVRYVLDKYGELTIYRHMDLDATGCPGTNYPFEKIVADAEKSGTSAEKSPSAPSAASNNKPDFNDPSKSLVQKFQEACIADGMPLTQYGADGIWGAETAKAASDLLQIGSTGYRVELVQRLLAGRGIVIAIDGIFGSQTHAAVRATQARAGLSVDGIVGVDTWRVLLGV